ncbi:F0F1 ATP synthase subunit gamma [Thermodesulfobacteriota bacterium]
METLELLNRKIKTAEDLLSVVKTMKSLAAVNIRQYELAVESLEEYKHIVDMGWQVLLRRSGPVALRARSKGTACMIFGSDQGMCGQFNEIILSTALEEADRLKAQALDVTLWGVGEKISNALMDSGHPSGEAFPVPGSVSSINAQVQEMVQSIESWRSSKKTEHVYLCHNTLAKGGGYEQTFYRLLPLDSDWIKEYKALQWPGRCLPTMGLSQALMFTHLFRQHLFVSLYRAFAQSLASENAARLMAMQAAEKNILERKDELQALFREQRQTAITSELFDIISGFEVLSDEMAGV